MRIDDKSLQWRQKGRGGVSNHQRLGYLLNRLFRLMSKKTQKLHVTGLCEGNSPVTGEFPAQRANNAENIYLMTSCFKPKYRGRRSGGLNLTL